MTDDRLVLTVDPDPAAPAAARRRAARWLTDRGVEPAILRDVLVVLSELVTNAVIHTRSPSSCTISIFDELIRIEVTDAHASPPTPARSPPSKPVGGFGLRIVHTLANRWHWTPTPDGGKVVWAELTRHRH